MSSVSALNSLLSSADPSSSIDLSSILEAAMGASSPGLDVTPPATMPVTVLRGHAHQFSDPALALRPGDRISLLAPAPPPAHRASTPQ